MVFLMNFGTVFKAFDTLVALREVSRRFRGTPPAETGLTALPPASGITGLIEARLTNVVVAALKEAFDRDHARLELERAHLDEQRRRAEDAMRLELRRQAADREVGRLRLLAGTALIGWIASVSLLVARLGSASTLSRAIICGGWLLLLAALASAFSAQNRIGSYVPDSHQPLDSGAAGAAALWLLIAGLGISATGLLF